MNYVKPVHMSKAKMGSLGLRARLGGAEPVAEPVWEEGKEGLWISLAGQ